MLHAPKELLSPCATAGQGIIFALSGCIKYQTLASLIMWLKNSMTIGWDGNATVMLSA